MKEAMQKFWSKTIILCVAAVVMAAGEWLGRWHIPMEVWIMLAGAAGLR